MRDRISVTALVVTFNRRELLLRCLRSIANQSRAPDRIIVLDNASTDGTRDSLVVGGWLADPRIELVALNENTGGAGGFAKGLERALDLDADWVWMMDDDALPRSDALERLLDRDLDENNLYGSVAIHGEMLSWPMKSSKEKDRHTIYSVSELPDCVPVHFLPFLGILVSSRLASKIGLPDEGFFLAADDVDYCMRARRAGAEAYLIGASKIEHPASERYPLIPGIDFYSLKLPPWKRYYDVRNRIFVAKNHYGAALYYRTIPGSFLRLMATLWHEASRWQQLKAFGAGMLDGLFNKKGRRHEQWGIK